MSGVLGKLFGKAAAEPIEATAKPIEAVGNLLDNVFTSKEEKLDKQAILDKIAQEPQQLQVLMNLKEAESSSIFKSGWRPFIGWVAGVSLALFFIPRFLVQAVVWTYLVIQQLAELTVVQLSTYQLPAFPSDGSDSLMELVLGMLGLALYRTIEKQTKVSK